MSKFEERHVIDTEYYRHPKKDHIQSGAAWKKGRKRAMEVSMQSVGIDPKDTQAYEDFYLDEYLPFLEDLIHVVVIIDEKAVKGPDTRSEAQKMSDAYPSGNVAHWG